MLFWYVARSGCGAGLVCWRLCMGIGCMVEMVYCNGVVYGQMIGVCVWMGGGVWVSADRCVRVMSVDRCVWVSVDEYVCM